MPADSCNRLVYLWQGRYSGLGWLFNAYHPRQSPWVEMPYAIDNGAFIAWMHRVPWNASRFLAGLDRYASHGIAPLWLLVPDVVADARATLDQWDVWAPRLRGFGWPLAFAAQDGHTPEQIPTDADVVFIGGTTTWKRTAIIPFCRRFPRVHVGRINGYRWLRYCFEAGAESCDGTGWFRGPPEKAEPLRRYLEEQAGRIPYPQQESIFSPDTWNEIHSQSLRRHEANLAHAE